MNESQKESITQEFQKKIQPLIETISSFIDGCSLSEKEKFSLTRIHSLFQTSISDTVNAISNNQSLDTITQMINNIDSEFTKFIKRLTYFLRKEQSTSEIPAIILDVQSKVKDSIDFLTNSISPSSSHQISDIVNIDIYEGKEEKKDIKPVLQEKETENINTETKIKQDINIITEDSNEEQQKNKKNSESINLGHKTQIEIDTNLNNEDSNKTPQESKNINEPINTNQKSEITMNEDTKETDQPIEIKTKRKSKSKHRNKHRKEQNQNDISKIEDTQTKDKQEIDNPTNKIEDTILDSPNKESKTELLNQIQKLNNEINTVKLRSNLLEKRLFELTQQSSNWTQSHIDEICEDPESALFDLLLEHQDFLNSRIKKMDKLNEELKFQIEEENSQTNQIVRNYRNQEEEIIKEIDDFLQSNEETRLNKANLDKIYFDMKMEIHDINEMCKMEQRSIENSINNLSEMAGQINSIEESNKDLRSEIKSYQIKCNEIENEIYLIKSRKTTNKIEALYQTMQDAEIDLFKTQKEYDTLVNTTIPDLQYKLKKISEEVGHLAAANRKEQEEAEFVDLQYIKDQVLSAFQL